MTDPQSEFGQHSELGEVLSIAGTNSLNFLETVFDCYARAQVFAISRPDTSLSELVTETRMLQAPADHELRRGWAKLDHPLNTSDSPAQIVFTSGTEGKPKPIVLSHRNLADVVTRLNEVMQISDDIREYIGVPVTYSFGLGRARAVSAAGGEFFLPERFDPSQIREMLEADEINAISAVPSLWQVILNTPEVIGAAGARVRWIEIGSQYMTGADKAAMVRLFPNAKIVQHYGLTEASRSTFLDISAASEDELDSVGRATGTVKLRINAEGAICIKGDHTALGQLGASEMITPLTDEDGWLTTKDEGTLKGDLLFYKGRLDNQINVSGVKLSAEMFEQDIAALVSGIEGKFAVTSVPDLMRGQAILLGLEKRLGDKTPLVEAAAKVALERRGISAGGVLHAMKVDQLPRTGTGKIQRKPLQEMFAERPEDQDRHTSSDNSLTDGQKKLVGTWRKVVGDVDIAPDQTFYDVGGDSLSSIQIGLTMEAASYDRATIRATLEGRTVYEISELSEKDAAQTKAQALPDPTVRNWSLSMTRAFMVLAVLLSHWGPGFFNQLGPDTMITAERYLAILYRIGTPGFATVFGIGIGMFMLPGFFENRTSILRRIRSSFLLVTCGLVLIALTRIALRLMAGEPVIWSFLSFAFYGVLVYYAVMLGTAWIWLPLIARLRHPIPVLLFMVPGMWLGWQIAISVLPAGPFESPIEWLRAIAVEGYNVFKMSIMACAGMAIGLWFSQTRDTKTVANSFLLVGALGAIFCAFSLVQSSGIDVLASRASPEFVSLTGLLMYISLSMFILGCFLTLNMNWDRLWSWGRFGAKLFIVIGGLALPIYVFHGLVIPFRNIFIFSGVPGGLAMLMPMSVFLIGIGYSGLRLYRMYFE